MSNATKSYLAILIIIVLPIAGISLLGLLVSTVESRNRENVVSKSIRIVKVGECQYVLWHNGRGSDMEHYESCQCRRRNP